MELTKEQQVAQDYKAAMDSVNLINSGKPADWTGTDADWADVITRNKEHLSIMVAKDFMQDQDLAPLHAAIAK